MSGEPAARLEEIRERIRRRQQLSPLAARDVKIIAVSKLQEEFDIRDLLDVGHRVFGENRVQEAEEKWPPLRQQYPEIELHLVGSLQTNKVREALELFDVIQTVDRANLVDAIIHEAEKIPDGTQTRQFFIQLNTGEEPQKGGVAPKEFKKLLAHCRARGLPVEGLMCIPPAGDNPAPHFGMLFKLAKENNLPYLSMGMTTDFDVALQLGATHIRIGTGIFGERARFIR